MRVLILIMILFSSIFVEKSVFSLASGAEIGRVTTSFDVRYSEAVLQKVSRLLSDGFKSDQVHSLMADIDAMKPEAPQAWNYRVVYKGRPHELRIRALVDDLGMIDLDFATDPELAAQIRGAVDSYLSRRN